MKILIADDQLIYQETLKLMLQPYGECVLVADGEMAVKAFETALTAGEPFNLVFLDIEMPYMDGQEALLKIRQIEKRARSVSLSQDKGPAVIFMQTSLEDPRQLVTAYKTGHCNGYINKPVEEQDLLERLRKHKLI